MKSGKQKKAEIKSRRKKKVGKTKIDPYKNTNPLPKGAVRADHSELVHNNTYGPLPYFYIDRPFVCRDCGSHEIWTAEQQKWWYEVAKGNIDSFAVRCRACRDKIKAKKDLQKEHMKKMAMKQPHPNEEFLKKNKR